MTVAVYASSAGNYFFAEVRALLAAGLRRAGRAVVEADERRGFVPGADLHLVVAPHEFFYLGAGLALRAGPWPEGVVLYNTEQLSSQWHRLAERLFPRARAVWDIDAAGARCAAAAGHRAAHVPLGWAPCALLEPVRRLPRAAREAWLEGPDPGPLAPWERRPLDVLFVGARTERREAFLARSAGALARWRSAVLVRDGGRPARPGKTTDLDTPLLLGLAQRAKVVLNLHRSTARFFEWHRIALHGMAQGALVVTEPCSDAAPFIPGRHFIAAAAEDIPRVLGRLLGTAAGRRRAARVAAAGRAAFRALDLGAVLRGALAALDGPPPAPLPPPVRRPDRAAARVAASGGRGGPVPAVTVAVSLHDYERVIGPCLDSAAAQTLGPLDLVVVDDASRDGSLAAARRWLKRRGRRFARWTLLSHAANAGLSAARNTAFAAARTPAVLVLDADNLLLPRCAGRLWSALRRTGADAAYPLLERFGEEQGLMNLEGWDPAALRRENTTDALALVRRSSWRRLGGYRSFEAGWEDYDFWLRLAASGGRAVQVPELLARYRVHLGSMLRTVTHANIGELRRRFRLEHGIAFAGDAESAPERLRRHALELLQEAR
ncbi:MAG: glycosyltransferase family 2 protein [Elusimicrobia bacterium]|nr:glycosyltransferase family 2 protein [Elusimicrobiota bacterium]